ncbi:symmetrical bis(5'-nucleosyl)-tetraphosphatase [Echinimonas agarilytica]|uniref:bis(5'-nucleosyl)-tetraphosphatase (symmetrical) n=1 Tax=Echinimonas agarilytica TaxID=1215918 RepID=A0AA41W8L5_9GAMM|nr:symmetrical bis(5'-nucleosyl)-tetraphosphatase [Echinimonas agarilytica]
MALYIVGDIQGCLDELQLLLERVKFSDSDTLWLCGDLVARGPRSLDTLRWVKQHKNTKTVLGNHDLHLLAVSEGIHPVKVKDRTAPIFEAQDRAELLTWLRQQPLLLTHSHYPIIMSHAGIYPEWTLEQAAFLAAEVEQKLSSDRYLSLLTSMYGNHPNVWHDDLVGCERDRFIINAFTRMRFCYPDGKLDFDAKENPQQTVNNLLPWYILRQQRFPNETATKLFGHWAALMGKTNSPDYVALDTGCVWGNHMSLLHWEAQQTVTQNALPKI